MTGQDLSALDRKTIARIMSESEEPNIWRVFVGDAEWDVLGTPSDARKQVLLELRLQHA